MNSIMYNKTLQALSLFVAIFMFTSCYKEDNSNCTTGVTVTVKVAPDSIDPDIDPLVKDVILYVFDSNGKFLEQRDTEIDKPEYLEYPNRGKLTVVALCNTAEGSVNVTEMSANSNISQGLVSLKTTGITKVTPVEIFNIPDDILHVQDQVLNNNTNEHKVVYVTRKVSSMKVTVRGLKGYLGGSNNDNYSIVVSSSKKEFNFNGQYLGEKVGYDRVLNINTNVSDEMVADFFRLMPSKDQTLSIRVYRNGVFVEEAFAGMDLDTGLYLTKFDAVENKTLNILLEFKKLEGGGVNVRVTVQQAEWHVETVWVSIS